MSIFQIFFKPGSSLGGWRRREGRYEGKGDVVVGGGGGGRGYRAGVTSGNR
jgi:hypothetical protein